MDVRGREEEVNGGEVEGQVMADMRGHGGGDGPVSEMRAAGIVVVDRSFVGEAIVEASVVEGVVVGSGVASGSVGWGTIAVAGFLQRADLGR